MDYSMKYKNNEYNNYENSYYNSYAVDYSDNNKYSAPKNEAYSSVLSYLVGGPFNYKSYYTYSQN
jgi:hypothetical protein